MKITHLNLSGSKYRLQNTANLFQNKTNCVIYCIENISGVYAFPLELILQ